MGADTLTHKTQMSSENTVKWRMDRRCCVTAHMQARDRQMGSSCQETEEGVTDSDFQGAKMFPLEGMEIIQN